MTCVCIIGNGIIGMTVAYHLLQQGVSGKDMTLVGNPSRDGCGSKAAPAMLNHVAELGEGALDHPLARRKFDMCLKANQRWERFILDVGNEIAVTPPLGRGTYVVNNGCTDSFEDRAFDAIVNYSREYELPYELVEPSLIEGYDPMEQGRALRAVYLDNENFVDSNAFLHSLELFLIKHGVRFVAAKAVSVKESGGRLLFAALDNGDTLAADSFLYAGGASYDSFLSNSGIDNSGPRVLFGSGFSMKIRPSGVSKYKPQVNCIRTPNRGLACGVYSAPTVDDGVVVGASNYISTKPLSFPLVTSVNALTKSAMLELNKAFITSGVEELRLGWRPTSEDTMPLLGRAYFDNFYVMTGTKRDGWHLSPYICEVLAALITKQRHEDLDDFKEFSPERSLHRLYAREKAVDEIVNSEFSAMYQHGYVSPFSNFEQEFKEKLRDEVEAVHDSVNAYDWGIPPELYKLYRAGHLC